MSKSFRVKVEVTLDRLKEVLDPYLDTPHEVEVKAFIDDFNALKVDNFPWELHLVETVSESNPFVNGVDLMIDEYFNMHCPQARSEASLLREIEDLRYILAYTKSTTGMLYTDDGELSDSTARPHIDYRRDSVATLRKKFAERYKQSLAAQPLPEVASAVGDMGQGLQLQLLRDGDGDIIVSVMPTGHQYTETAVEFCVPGSGGGRGRHTFTALQNLMRAMEADAKGSQYPER
jgi:hypothetical protein